MISEHSHMPGAIYALTGEDDHASGQWQTFQHSYMPNDSTLIDSTPYIRGDRVLELAELVIREHRRQADADGFVSYEIDDAQMIAKSLLGK